MAEQDKAWNLDEIYAYFKRFALADGLFIAGVVNAAMRYGYNALDTEEIPAGTIRWINDHSNNFVQRFDLSIKMTRFARFLLLSPSNDYKKEILDTGTQPLHDALNMIRGLHDKDVEGEIKSMRDLVRVFGRLGQVKFPLQADRSYVIGRAHLLFIQIPEEIKPHYNFDEKLNEHYGINIYPYMATGLALWITSKGILKHNMMVEVEELKGVVTKETVNKFVELSTGTAEEYRRWIRGDDWKTPNKLRDIYALEPFIRMPGIKVNFSMHLEIGSYVVPQPMYLLQKATMGLFYLLADKEREIALSAGNEGQNFFRDDFGNVYRAYIGKQLSQARRGVSVIDLDEEIKTEDMKPDFALIDGNTCILFEVKTALLTLDSRLIFDEVSAKDQIQKGNFKKALKQLTDFEKAILTGQIEHKKLKGIKHIVKVIVGFEEIFLANAFLLPMFRELRGSEVQNLQIATINDMDALGATLAGKGKIGKWMLEKIGTPEVAEWSLAGFFAQKMKNMQFKNMVLQKGYEDFISKMTGKDLAKIIGEEETEDALKRVFRRYKEHLSDTIKLIGRAVVTAKQSVMRQ
jgi:hypothetical protein